jgi:signal transduction histidine kinase
MGEFFQQIIATLTTYPGNLVYLMILVFSIAGAFQAALNLWRNNGFPQGRRMVYGLAFLLAAYLVLFLGMGLAEKAFELPNSLLPVMERSVAVLSLILIIWLWAFPEPFRAADIAAALLAGLTAILTILSLLWWWGNNEFFFNQTWLDIGWEIYSISLILLGVVLLLYRRPNSLGIGLTIFVILFVGHITHLINPIQESDIAGSVRLAQMAAYPLLLALPHRFQIPIASQTAAEKPKALLQERIQYGIDPKVFESIVSIAAQKTFADTSQKITESVARAILSDICLAILPVNLEGQIVILNGFDLIRQKKLDGSVIEGHEAPMLLAAMKQAAPLRLPASSTSQDLTLFAKKLNMERAGHLLASFVKGKDQSPILGLILLSPYSNRSWSKDDESYLADITAMMAHTLQSRKQSISTQEEFTKTQRELRVYQDMVEEMRNENAGLLAVLSDIQPSSLRTNQPGSEIPIDPIQPYQLEIKRLQAENLRLEELVEKLIADLEKQTNQTNVEQLEGELHLALEEISRLKLRLVAADQAAINLQTKPNDSGQRAETQVEEFTTIAQELRQPLSSIMGYSDLLLGETVGILGALQRKFLERIKASTERMQIMLDDLLQVVTLESDQLQLKHEMINLSDIIDDAILATSNQLQDRKIILRVDLPEQLPKLQADKDALSQVVFHLLKNAGDASPIEGEVLIRTSPYQTNDHQQYILIQVADQGGGISTEDIPRVFSRSYRADNPTIDGVGDSGVGLSIAKTLVEAHKGRIWVDSEAGQGSTFSVLIPLQNGKSRE